MMRGEIKRSETILIHSGAGGIGLAAIHLALHHGCTVFTTVGSQDKRIFLKKHFRNLMVKYSTCNKQIVF
ncbi:hypothetical protein NQ314_005287 [Rhamnusium bicolor]|uniref:Uncharacterized protein n=1 Tax=Rhamnusium bicolor TaxID=1586634 RepID=A0AAV8ZHI5_9CUCU|nr:hypothetical protein NQ314_005287 [Rhamnusium bicolor]